MPRLALTKAELARQKQNLATFERFLPSLDLKRRQLLAERNKQAARLAEIEEAIALLSQEVAKNLPMLADRQIALDRLLRIEGVEHRTEIILGVVLPRLERIEVGHSDYGRLTKPHWVDRALSLLEEALRLRIQCEIAQDRLALLEAAVRKITQRVNLFEKVLIPRAEAAIRRIRIKLSDSERAAVVTSKIAKARSESRAAW